MSTDHPEGSVTIGALGYPARCPEAGAVIRAGWVCAMPTLAGAR